MPREKRPSPDKIKKIADRAEGLIPDAPEVSPGRPSEYKPEYGREIVNLMATGLSLTAAAADLGFHRDTIYEWEKVHPDFSDAIKLARAKRVLSLERELLSASEGPRVTARIFALKNADPTEWREKVQQEVSGPDGDDIKLRVKDNAADFTSRILEVIAARSGEGGS